MGATQSDVLKWNKAHMLFWHGLLCRHFQYTNCIFSIYFGKCIHIIILSMLASIYVGNGSHPSKLEHKVLTRVRLLNDVLKLFLESIPQHVI